jgi:hypothetical protein
MYICAMCEFETDDEAAAYDHDCMKPTESHDSDPPPHVHHVRESVPWWAEAFPQWKGKGDNDKP